MMDPEEQRGATKWYISHGVQGFDLNSLPRCSAFAKTTHKRCKNPAMKGKEVCCVHAGLYKPGAPVGNTNSLKHGLYTAKMVAERQSARAFMKDAEEFLGSFLG